MKKYKVKFKTLCECTMEETLMLLEEGKTHDQIRIDVHHELSNNLPFYLRESWYGNEVVFDFVKELETLSKFLIAIDKYSVLGTVVPKAFIKSIEECEEV